ncbi:MAG: 3-dehydroquinate synthase [candidate division FCPU426 bacterium]
MPTVWVRFGDRRDYPIRVQPGALSRTGAWMRQRVAGRTACLITHPALQRLYGLRVSASLRAAGFDVLTLLVPAGETSKSLAWAERLISSMLRRRLDRSACVVALGGGVVGDLAGFVASVYLRGIEFVQIPTTLLAQVDSSVGGKVAVNHALGKNLIGAFLQPRLVVTDPETLRSLPRRQFRSGLAEMIKAAIIADAAFFKYLEKNLPLLLARDPKALSRALAWTCAIKGRVVEQDETEKNLRAILNYGHTFGHALETYHHYKQYLHGEAVAVGMVIAARLAQQTGLLSQTDSERQVRLIKMAGLPTVGKGENIQAIMSLMKIDKKARSGQNSFVLTPKIGGARIVRKIPPFSVQQALKTVLRKA